MRNLGVLDIVIKGRSSVKHSMATLKDRVKGTFFEKIRLVEVQPLLSTIEANQVVYLFRIIWHTTHSFDIQSFNY